MALAPILGEFDPNCLKHRPHFRMDVMEESRNCAAGEKVQLASYSEMLNRAFNLMHHQHPDNERISKIALPSLSITRKAKKTIFTNFVPVCEIMKRDVEHVKQYICTEMNTDASVDGNGGLIISGRLQQTQIEKLILQYVRTYVQCPVCGSMDTKLEKTNRILFIICNQCTASRSVQQIRGGFVANTTKRRNRV